MQDIYAFDVGDFGKIGLLRHLHRRTGLRLGVLWYRTHLGTGGADGKHVGYLKQPWYRACDPDLWDEMAQRFDPENRTIARLCPLFPAGTVFHDTPMPTIDRRETWFEHAKATVRQAEVVFCDPDMGVIFDGPCRSPGHIGLAEISRLFAAGHSLVVYHHLSRSDKHDAQIESALNRFQREIAGLAAGRGAWFRRGSSRVFFVLAQERHAEGLIKALDDMESTTWCRDGHFVIAPSATAGRTTARLAAGRTTSGAVPRVNFGFGSSSADRHIPRHHNAELTPTSLAEQITEGRVVTVVLNDNGGLNLAANPWLAEIAVPCRLKTARVTFTVEAAFQGRYDMYRTLPSTLKLARHQGFAGAHLSKPTAISFEAAIERTTTPQGA